MYRLEPDLMNSRIIYVYEDTENATRCKMTIIQDADLAHRVLEFLNKEESKALVVQK